MYKGISNLEIERTLDNEYINKHFIDVFTSDKINKFINFHQVVKAKVAKYPLLISNIYDTFF